MRAVCARKDLYHGIQTVSRAIANRLSYPILNNVLICSDGNSLRLTAFDQEIGIECSVQASVVEEGSLTVPARLLSEVLGTMPESDVQISVNEQDSVNIRCEKSDYTLLGLPPEEFPQLPEVPDECGFDITQAALQDVIEQTVFAVSPDESTAIYTGVLFSLSPDGVRFVSTDRKRLAIHDCQVGNIRGEARCIVQKKVLDELGRLLKDEDTPVYVSIADSQIKFVVDGVTIVSRLIEGQFLDYERVVPGECRTKWTVQTEEFLSCVRRAAIVARENANRIYLKTEGDQLILTAESGDVGRAYEELDVVKEGEDIEIIFSSKFLMDFLSVVGSEGVAIEMTEPLKSTLMKPVGMDDYKYVFMPLQPAASL